VATLARLNGIANPNLIRPGQRLTIPGSDSGGIVNPVPAPTVVNATSVPTNQPRTYIVRAGDTLYRVALRFGVPARNIIQANNIANPNRIYTGQVLVIP
jgi:putative chitinase